MGEKKKETAVVIRQDSIAPNIYSMWLRTDEVARYAKPGQFVCGNNSP